MNFVIFSPEKGFWRQQGDWVQSPSEASELGERDFNHVRQQVSELRDGRARVVQKSLYSHETPQGIADRLSEIVGFTAIEEIPEFLCQVTDVKDISYLDGDRWLIGDEVLDSFELEDWVCRELKQLSLPSLETLYNQFSGNLCYPAGRGGFFHQECL